VLGVHALPAAALVRALHPRSIGNDERP